jgi:hypothetical protein
LSGTSGISPGGVLGLSAGAVPGCPGFLSSRFSNAALHAPGSVLNGSAEGGPLRSAGGQRRREPPAACCAAARDAGAAPHRAASRRGAPPHGGHAAATGKPCSSMAGTRA